MQTAQLEDGRENRTKEDEALDTPQELAAALKVSRPQVMNWYHAGKIPARIASGRIYRFNRKEVLRALEVAG